MMHRQSLLALPLILAALSPSVGSAASSRTNACSGTAEPIIAIFPDHLSLRAASGRLVDVRLAPVVRYGSGATGPDVGNLVSYVGRKSSAGVCLAQKMTINAPVAPLAFTGTAPVGQLTVPYATTFTAVGGLGPYQWSATGLPPGLTLQGGVLSGTPTSEGTFSVTITVQDSSGAVVTHAYSILIQPAVCALPPYAPEQGRGQITGIFNGIVMVSGTQLQLNTCTVVSLGSASALTVGQTVSWQGYRFRTRVSASTLTVE